MNDYFDHVERSLREGARRRLHMPWYARLLPPRSRTAVIGVLVLLGGGTALAATGALRTGASVSSEVRPLPYAGEGTVIPSSVRVLPTRARDPQGGPPWGLRLARTSRGLLCVQVGRVLDGRIGVLGRDGAFHDDGAFHPYAPGYLSGVGCATEDARGNAFIDYQLHGIPASGLLENRRDTSGGCYGAASRTASCPPGQLRDVYFGMLGPDATSVTARTAAGATSTVATAGPSGAYLVVLPHSERPCEPGAIVCDVGGGGNRGYTFSPTLPSNEVITRVTYRNAPPCRLPDPEEAQQRHHAKLLALRDTLRHEHPDLYTRLYRGGSLEPAGLDTLSPRQLAEFQALRGPIGQPSCPAVGFVAPSTPQGAPTRSQLASPVSVHVEPAARYCERAETIIPCDRGIPQGYKPLRMNGPREILLVVDFTARRAVTNFDSHYEIETSATEAPGRPGFRPECSGSRFGPTQTNLRAGQHVRHTFLMNLACPGTTHVTVGYVTVNGPSSATPVPGLPGQSAAIPVGQATVQIP